MKKITILLGIMLLPPFCASQAQRVLNLDSCRALAIDNNKNIKIAQEKIKKAHYDNKAAYTKYLPNLSATGSYMYNSREMQLLSNESQQKLRNIGTTMQGSISGRLGQVISSMASANPQLATMLGQAFGALDFSTIGNALGSGIVDAFETDTRNVWAGMVTISEPLYAGGKITAYNKITALSEELAKSQLNTTIDELIQSTDLVYWQVVSLKNKMKLAESYLKVLTKLENDIRRMKEEGVATTADELSVSVKVNEAQTDLLRAENGYELSKMLLCQVCGIPLSTDLNLADENLDNLAWTKATAEMNIETAMENRSELKSLRLANDIYDQKVKIVRSDFLPTVAVAGNYIISNPSVFNGFEKKFKGMFNIGLMVQLPIYHFGEGSYKVNAARAEANISRLTLSEVQEKIELQVNQCSNKSKEAKKRLSMAEKNMDKANENLRCANLGFQEGVITTSNVLAAQTAWMKANSEKIDAQIDVIMADINMKKAMGILK